MKCPNCDNGVGPTPAHIRFAPGKEPKTDAELKAAYEALSKCRTCDGTGQVTAEKLLWLSLGNAMRQRRKDLGYGLRHAAETIGMSPVLLSKMEQGEIEPKLEVLDELSTRS